MKHFLGAHTIDNGGIDQAVRRAANSGMSAMQLFSAIPKYYGDKTSIRPERVEKFKKALKEAKIDPANVVVHAAYVLNTATADEAKWGRAAAGLSKELERSTALGVGAFCYHPGAANDGDRLGAVKRIARAITQALETTGGTTRILVENTAGAGLTMGKTPDEIGAILACIPAELRARTGYGLDTCHLFAAGHDITKSKQAFTAVLNGFEKAAGEPPSFFHLNDSEGGLASNRDRHVLIGAGQIGVEPFRWLLADKRSRGVPLILETPQQNMDIPGEDPSPDPYDMQMMELLTSLRVSGA
jgi:deoxyribonuclease IV